MQDGPEAIKTLGDRTAKYLRQAEEHEAKAKELRAKAQKCAARLAELAGVSGAKKPARKLAQAEDVEASHRGASEAIRNWARQIARPFRFPEAFAVMQGVNPEITNGPFYHLVRRGEIKKLERGLFVHPDYFEQVTGAGVVEEGANGATH